MCAFGRVRFALPLTVFVLAALPGLVSPWGSALAAQADDGPPDSCEALEGATTASACLGSLETRLGRELTEELVGRPGAQSLTLAMDVAEHVFTELLKERTLQAQVAHLAFRDGIDLANAGDAWDTARRVNEGTMGATMLGVNSACTSPYPSVERLRAQAVEQFFTFGREATEHNARIFRRLESFMIGGGPAGDPRCKGEPMCRPMGDRALKAKNYADLLHYMENNDDTENPLYARNSAALSRILTSDPALNEYVETEPGGCASGPEASEGRCQRAFEYMGGLEENARRYGRNPAEHAQDLREVYQQANRTMKDKVRHAIYLTCNGDASDMVLSPVIAGSVLAEFPGFASVYCRMRARKLRQRRIDEALQTTLAVAAWGATGASVVASFVTGGATTPITLGLAASAGFATRYKLRELQAEDDLLASIQMVGATAADPRTPEGLAAAVEEYRREFRNELKMVVLTMGLEAAVASIRSLRAAGKLTRLQEDALIAEAQREARRAPAAGRPRPMASASGFTPGAVEVPLTLGGTRTVTAEALDQADSAALVRLEKIGVRYQRLDSSGQYRSLMDEMISETLPPGSPGSPLLGRVGLYQVTADGLPAVGRDHVTEQALRHPEMRRHIEELERAGYKLVIDSGLRLDTTIGAYQWAHNRVIALRPDSTWQTFLHEYEHFLFNRKVIERLGMERIEKLAKTVSRRTLSRIRRVNPQAARAIELARRGLPENAIDETMAVERELRALSEAGYRRFGIEYASSREYALFHQIRDLRAIPRADRTATQQRTLSLAVAERLLMQGIMKAPEVAPAVAAGALGALGVTVPVGIGAVVLFEEEIRHFIVRLRDGRVYSVSPEDLLRDLSADEIEQLANITPPGEPSPN